MPDASAVPLAAIGASFAPLVYILCTLTSLLSALLLLRAFLRSRHRLLLWSSLCFFGLSLTNVFLFIDIVVLGPISNLTTLRQITTIVALGILIFGLVFDSE